LNGARMLEEDDLLGEVEVAAQADQGCVLLGHLQMFLLVSSEGAGVGELGAADRTGVRLLLGVNSLVLLHIRQLPEGEATVGTGIGQTTVV